MVLHVETPTLRCQSLSNDDIDVWMKLEALQPSGSFKLRGIGKVLEEGLRGKNGDVVVYSSSGGNAGMAAAWASRALRLECRVVVPESTGIRAREVIKSFGAKVIVHGKTWKEANDFMMGLVEEKDLTVHPFDGETLWEGHASMIEEVAKVMDEPDYVVFSVGGGGLMCGVMRGLEKVGWKRCKILAVETRGADSLDQSIKKGERVVLDGITSIAKSLGAVQVCQEAFRYAMEDRVETRVVEDGEALEACKEFLDKERILVEPACGAALAGVKGLRGKVLVIVCGGATWGATDLLS